MTICAGIRNLVIIGHCRADEPERVTANVDISDRLFNFRHVTSDTLVSRASDLVMCVFFSRTCMRAIW